MINICSYRSLLGNWIIGYKPFQMHATEILLMSTRRYRFHTTYTVSRFRTRFRFTIPRKALAQCTQICAFNSNRFSLENQANELRNGCEWVNEWVFCAGPELQFATVLFLFYAMHHSYELRYFLVFDDWHHFWMAFEFAVCRCQKQKNITKQQDMCGTAYVNIQKKIYVQFIQCFYSKALFDVSEYFHSESSREMRSKTDEKKKQKQHPKNFRSALFFVDF